jgi:hypothetical protein
MSTSVSRLDPGAYLLGLSIGRRSSFFSPPFFPLFDLKMYHVPGGKFTNQTNTTQMTANTNTASVPTNKSLMPVGRYANS